MVKSTFAVSGMKCVHCKENVEKALCAVDGVRSAEASVGEAHVAVEYDETKVSTTQLKEAVSNCGRYELTV